MLALLVKPVISLPSLPSEELEQHRFRRASRHDVQTRQGTRQVPENTIWEPTFHYIRPTLV